jgi:hypothetical protein
MAKNDLTAETLRQLLDYNPETGNFHWKVVRRSAHGATKIGGIAGHRMKIGYITIGILGSMYTAHRLAFLWMNGEWPTHHVDHVNRDPACNAWANLREATHKQNHENRVARRDSTTGILGVYQRSPGVWQAKIKHNRKSYHLGCFKSPEEAEAARKAAEASLFTHSPACEPPP